jgi:hypothetical protein
MGFTMSSNTPINDELLAVFQGMPGGREGIQG